MKDYFKSYKNKNKLLIAGSILFLLIIYSAAVKPTIAMYTRLKLVNSKINEYAMERSKIIEYEKYIKYLDNNVNTGRAIDSNTEQNLLELISNYCKDQNVLLKEFPKTIKYTNQNYLIENHVFELQGGFIDMLKFDYQLEQINKIGKVISIQFQAVKDLKTQSIFLVSTIYVQKIKTIKNENG